MSEPVDPEEFRNRVLEIAQRAFPDITISAPPTEWDLLIAGKVQIGLGNMRAKYTQSQRSDGELEGIVRDHFAALLDPATEAVPDFEEARDRLRPQIMPMEFAVEMPLIAFPFAPELMVGLVLDGESSYLYLKPEHAENWGKTHLELLDAALENLDQSSRGMGLHYSENEDTKVMFVQQSDGFDAARVLLPDLRKLAASKFGENWFFAIPNRDFLMFWNLDAPDDLQQSLRAQIKVDYASQPYPLSPRIFRISADGEIHEEPAPAEPDLS